MLAGDVPAACSAAPLIAESLEEHVRVAMGAGCVEAPLKALCAAMTAAVNFCEPLLVRQRGNARRLGVSIEKLNDLWEFARSDRYGGAERAALSAAVALSREPRALPPAVWTALREHFDDAQVAEILCVIGLVNYLTRVCNAFDTEHPKPAASAPQ